MKAFEAMRTTSLAIGIGILIPLTVYYGVQLIKPSPTFPSIAVKMPEHLERSATEEERQEHEAKMKTYQEAKEKTMHEYHNTLRDYETFYFYVAFCTGIILFILGSLLIPVDFLGGGTILGGILTLVTGYTLVWGHLSNLIKFLSLLGGLLLLFILGMVIGRKIQGGKNE